jgi:hypothetical protein
LIDDLSELPRDVAANSVIEDIRPASAVAVT